MKKTCGVLFFSLVLFSFQAWAEEGIDELVFTEEELLALEAIEPITIYATATRIRMPDTEAPYASEIHTGEDIMRSGATDLTEYLSRYTSLQVMPSFGNRLTPSINMRGYGATEGYQNLVVSVDGRRLNNIDMVPQILGSVFLADVEKIEITKGSGSILHGDGAMAGSIQIYTKPRDGAQLEAFAGNGGLWGTRLGAGMVRDRFALSAKTERQIADGFAKPDQNGKKDDSEVENWQLSLEGRPIEALRLSLDVLRTEYDVRYANPLTLAEFRRDPATAGTSGWMGRVYSRQKLDSRIWSFGADYEANSFLTFRLRHDRENKNSEFPDSFYKTGYEYRSSDFSVEWEKDSFALVAGVQYFDGSRDDGSSATSRENLGWYIQGQYFLHNLTLSLGARTEDIEYEYKPSAGSRLKDDMRLSSFDLGLNYRVSEDFSLFGNYNRGFLAPDIDRFFGFDSSWNVVFNDFIDPARAHTFNLGFNHTTKKNKLKFTTFYVKLEDEIYYCQDPSSPAAYMNTNIDKSHKYGIELQDRFLINDIFSVGLNYSWTKAEIDRQGMGAVTYKGKDLPGVPEHSLIVGLTAKVFTDGELSLYHTWRSRCWAAEDFANNGSQKQRSYQSTDISFHKKLHKNFEIFASIQNLLEKENGMWIRDDAIYPVDYSRTWKIGGKFIF
ncbi:TonB-dependent receptor [Desulfococcaceae bacterium OttesenSCG-928-F15]|nr:TonB-dependent receptor [Desulfococcaceae bacterium OttesenSCG-928-F15]